MVDHSTLCRSIKYDYMNILTWTILKKTQILNGCETFAFKYISVVFHYFKFGSSSVICWCSSSVVECLTQDRGAAGSRLTGVTALCP